MYILSKKIVSASANCSQQHNVVQHILPGSSSARAPYQKYSGHEAAHFGGWIFLLLIIEECRLHMLTKTQLVLSIKLD